jgi:predicted ABC-type ATPase
MDKLSISELETIFNNKIYPELIFEKSKGDKKETAIIGGQPGSGKSSAVSLLFDENPNFVFINGDDFREFLPGYKELTKSNPDNAADLSQYAVNFWVEKAIDRCMEEELSLIVEGTMRVPGTSLKTALMLKESGYAVTFVLVSTPYELSLESIRERYNQSVELFGAGRSVKIESHDEAFIGIKKTILVLFNAKVAERFVIINRLQNSTLEFHEFDPENEREILDQFNKGRADTPGRESSREIDQNSVIQVENTNPVTK